MPKEPSCKCGECRLCKQRECQRIIRQEKARLRDIVWPTDTWGESVAAECARLLEYSSALSDMDAARWFIRSSKTARKAGAE